MIEFPRELHPLHTFELDGKLYAADLENGLVAEIDEIIAFILERCQSYTTAQLIQQLEKLYEKSAIWETFERLEQLAAVGMLFGDKLIPIEMTTSKFNLFICPGFFTSSGNSRFTTKLEKYYLLNALAQQIGVYAGIDQSQKEFNSEEIDFETVGIHKVPIPRNWTYAGARYIPDECLGICSLSSDLDAMHFLYYDFRPLINRVYCSKFTNESILQSFIVKCSLFSSGNALCVDTSYLKRQIENRLPENWPSNSRQIFVIPNGINHSVFKPLDKVSCKSNLSSAIGNELFFKKPLVLIFSSVWLDESYVFKLALANPDIAFLLIDSPLERFAREKPENLEFYPVEEAKDFDALSVIFNAGDLGFFPATFGVASTHIFSAMACGVPMIVAGDEMPEEVGSAGVFLRLNRDSSGNIEVPVKLLSEKMKFLLSHAEQLSFLSASAVKRVERWTWDAVATQFLELYRELAQQKTGKPIRPRFPIGFWQVYNQDGTVESQAIGLATFRQYPIEEALALTLLAEHTSQEIITVLSHVLQNEQKTKEVLNRAIALSESQKHNS